VVWIVLVLTALAAALVKLGALSVWVTVLSAATKILAFIALALTGVLTLRVLLR
jgi:hypothetical protein